MYVVNLAQRGWTYHTRACIFIHPPDIMTINIPGTRISIAVNSSPPLLSLRRYTQPTLWVPWEPYAASASRYVPKLPK